ncbi:helix-turn-helix domain-containing protein [Streptomyces sp. NPDC088246]|uniref:helix-turn-helix domain-containing protein n=1 Tax=Streptomyces sp. NPDC088246 TaxID=3365842 RepID=UPI003806FED2
MLAVPSDQFPQPPLGRYLSLRGFSPTALSMALGSRLRALRTAAGVSAKEAATEIRCSEAKISRLERGQSPPQPGDVSCLMRRYGAVDEIEDACELARRANEPGWWEEFGSVVPPWFDKFLGLQEAADLIRTYEVQLVPGLLQTEEYARAVTMSGVPLAGPEEVRARVGLRTRRQELLHREFSPKLWAVVDWPVLHRPLGSSGLMCRQLEHLIEMSHSPNIKLQVLPPDCLAIGTPVTLLRFGLPDLPDVVYLEHPTGANYIDKPEDTAQYRSMLDQLSMKALSPAETLVELKKTALSIR